MVGRSEEQAEALLREYLGGANDRRQRMDFTTPLLRNSEGAVSLYLPGIQVGTLLHSLLANGSHMLHNLVANGSHMLQPTGQWVAYAAAYWPMGRTCCKVSLPSRCT